MVPGIVFVLLACFCWALVFVVPNFMEAFSSFEVAIGRYFFYGLISLFLSIGRMKVIKTVSNKVWITALWFSFVVNIFYFTSFVMGLRLTTPSMAALILGTEPIAIAIYGNLKEKTYDFRKLIAPCAIIGIGLVLVNISVFTDSFVSLSEYLIGIIFCFLSLASWTWFVVANVQFMRRHSQISEGDWSNILGLTTFIWVILGMGGAFTFAGETFWNKYTVFNDELNAFLIGSATLGLVCSWLGFYFWYCSGRYLTVSMSGQLTIFETLFGLVFIHVVESHTPTLFEFLGMIIMLFGIVISMNTLRGKSTEGLGQNTLEIVVGMERDAT